MKVKKDCPQFLPFFREMWFQFQPNALLLPFLVFHETTKATETTKTLRHYGGILEHIDYTLEIDWIMNTV